MDAKATIAIDIAIDTSSDRLKTQQCVKHAHFR